MGNEADHFVISEVHGVAAQRALDPRSSIPDPVFRVVLINPYELGRQPFNLAEPAAWLQRAGFHVACIDLSLQKLDPEILSNAGLVAVYLGMHTATRIAIEALPRIRSLAPYAHLCAYGLYAPMNAGLLRNLGVGTILGGEFEPALVKLAEKLERGQSPENEAGIHLGKIEFIPPDRTPLPPLSRYARLELADGGEKMVGFAEASRGCKHLCRHCPVVPVYQGRFRVVPVDVVMADIRAQVAAGAQHISFGDPDFLNGPGHAIKVVRGLNAEFPGVTYDAVIKIQHLVEHADLLPALKETGCLFITSAVEAVDDEVLSRLDKNHTVRNFEQVVELLRGVGIEFAPTFVAFTPWTTVEGYLDLLKKLVELRLVESVPPVQLTIRLLVPEGSYLLKLPGFRDLLDDFDANLLGYPWRHSDPGVDALQQAVQSLVAQSDGRARREIFQAIWRLAHDALDRAPPSIEESDFGAPIPHLSEPWYCCAEPTTQQLQIF
jgi:radical SAM superfamily enzyme YgiQ (UPF0313 family)